MGSYFRCGCSVFFGRNIHHQRLLVWFINAPFFRGKAALLCFCGCLAFPGLALVSFATAVSLEWLLERLITNKLIEPKKDETLGEIGGQCDT